MTANELRIGNYVLIDNGEFIPFGIVKFISHNEIVVGSDLYDLTSIDGIPLTEEWLLKFGFEFWLDELGVKAYFKVYGIEYLCVATNGFWQIRSGLNSHNSSWRMGQNYPFIIYVHQLQNLYYALTGEELTIKTK